MCTWSEMALQDWKRNAEKRTREDVGKLRKVKSAEFIVIVLRCNY